LLGGFGTDDGWGRKRDPDVIKGTEYEDYERTIAMLNDTMEMCLR
jgi:hypothetical protein